MIAAALLVAQAVGPASAGRSTMQATPPQRFSILADPCASADDGGRDIVVCGRPDASPPRLPLLDVRGAPNHPVPSNPEMIAGGARSSAADYVRECGRYGEDCYGSASGSVVPLLVGGAADLAHRMFARKPDKRGRVVIDLDAPPAAIPADAIKP